MARSVGPRSWTACALALALLAAPARAQELACPEHDPSDEEVTRRLRWIERRFAESEGDVRLWFTGFVALQGLLVGVQIARLAAASTDEERIDPIVSGVGSTLGLTTLLIGVPPILGAGDAMRAAPRATSGERLASLRAAEARLRASAAASSDVRSDISAISSILYTEAAALTLLFLGQLRDAFFQAGGGILIGLGRIALHPTGAVRAWAIYRAHHPDAGCALDVVPPTSALRITPSIGPAGIGVTLAF